MFVLVGCKIYMRSLNIFSCFLPSLMFLYQGRVVYMMIFCLVLSLVNPRMVL